MDSIKVLTQALESLQSEVMKISDEMDRIEDNLNRKKALMVEYFGRIANLEGAINILEKEYASQDQETK